VPNPLSVVRQKYLGIILYAIRKGISGTPHSV
jgi:hypothetical protein